MYSQTTLVHGGKGEKRFDVANARTSVIVSDRALEQNRRHANRWIDPARERRSAKSTGQLGMERHPDSLWQVLWSYRTLRPR